MTTYKTFNTYVGIVHSPDGVGGFYATGKTRMEVITKLLLQIYI